MPVHAPPSEWELTPDELKLIQKRAQLRAATKAEFLKRYRNPFNSGVPGHFVRSSRAIDSRLQLNIHPLGRSTKHASLCLSTEHVPVLVHLAEIAARARTLRSRGHGHSILRPEDSSNVSTCTASSRSIVSSALDRLQQRLQRGKDSIRQSTGLQCLSLTEQFAPSLRTRPPSTIAFSCSCVDLILSRLKAYTIKDRCSPSYIPKEIIASVLHLETKVSDPLAP